MVRDYVQREQAVMENRPTYEQIADMWRPLFLFGVVFNYVLLLTHCGGAQS